jgi:hypothetical protein
VPADVIRTRIAAASAAILLAGCSAAPSSNAVFGGTRGADAGDFISGIVLAGQHYIYDIMIPDLHNHSSRSVRLTSVRLISPHRSAVRVLGVTAYPWSHITHGTAFVDEGDLGKGCREQFAPHPVTDVMVRPHSDANFVLYIALILREPGHYNFGRAMITYVTGGQHNSQVYYLPNIHLRTVSRRRYPHLYQPDVCGKNG